MESEESTELLNYMTSNMVHILLVRGTRIAEDLSYTIRGHAVGVNLGGRYGVGSIREMYDAINGPNSIHSSDNRQEAIREIRIWFGNSYLPLQSI